MQLKLSAEKEDCHIVQLQETVPFVDTGSPERSRKGGAQHQLGETRLGDRFSNRIHPLKEPLDRVPYVAHVSPRHRVSLLRNAPSRTRPLPGDRAWCRVS